MSKRILVINAEIQKAISDILLFELQNPKITGFISVIKVSTTTDLENCKVYLSIFNSDDAEETFNQIKHSGTFIRKQLAGKVDLRKMPFLEFRLDKGNEDLIKIEELIAKTKK